MSVLHTINKSPYTFNMFASCLRVCKKTDGILLLEDGVYGCISSAPTAQELQMLISQGVNVFALTNDIKARGLDGKLVSNIQLIDYDLFVQLTIDYHCVQSWY